MCLGPINAVKQTVGPDWNKRMRQSAIIVFGYFFFVIGKVPFFDLMLIDRLRLRK